MQLDFWQQRWNQNQIAFHLPTINPYLLKYWQQFEIKSGSEVFVPLCGKTLDIAWLASQQYSVLGVECSEKAIQEFFSEQNMVAQTTQLNDFKCYSSDNIKLLQGDFFKLNKKILSNVSVVYDRASLIALPETMRKKYVSLLSHLLPESAEIFLITLDYDQLLMSGPPFSVTHDEVSNLYQAHYDLELLYEHDVLEAQQRFKERGLNYLIERVYRLVRRS